jgi:hypothetical protein
LETNVGRKDRGKGVKQGSEFLRSGKRRKVGEEGEDETGMEEHQISSYFEMAMKKGKGTENMEAEAEDGTIDVSERINVTPVCEVVSENENNVVDEGKVENAETALPSEVKLAGETESRDHAVAEPHPKKKDSTLHVDSTSAAPPAHPQSLIGAAFSQEQQWVHDVLTDPSPVHQHNQPTPEGPFAPSATLFEPQNNQQSPPPCSSQNSTARLIRYAESLLPGNNRTYDPNPRPQRVLFSMDQDETPAVWGNSYNPFENPSNTAMEDLPEMEAQNTDERVVECFMYPIEEDDEFRYISGPAFDPERHQPWKYGREAQDETLYHSPDYHIPERYPEMMGFRGGKHGEIDLGERIPLIRTGPNFRNRYNSTLETNFE